MLISTGMYSRKSSLPNAFWSCESQGSSPQVFPSTEAAYSKVIRICKALAGTVQVGGKENLSPVPFSPTVGRLLLSCANCPCTLGPSTLELELLPKKSSNY